MAIKSVGFIGVGVMGEPMCRNIALKSGAAVVAFDLDRGALERLGKAGVKPVQNAGQAVELSDVVCFSLPSGEVLQDVVRAPDGPAARARQGQIFIDLGTTQVGVTRELASAFAAKGSLYLDAPVARTREAAQSGTLAVTVGGNQDAFAKVRTILECIASDITYCGETGAGQILKILNNMVVFETVAALSEALALGQKAGLSGKFLFETLAKGSADSFTLRNHGLKAMVPESFPERAFSVRYAQKDIRYAIELADQLGVQLRGAHLVDSLFEQAIEAGWGDMYNPVISRLFRPGTVAKN